ncbi:MAG TPA: LamG-like jellyroll fold domain-containing protein [Natronosporangium sp.]
MALLTAAAAHDPGWRNAFAATANSLAQSGEVPVIAGDYSGPTPWIASTARDGSVLGRVFVALGLDYRPVAGGGDSAQPAAGGDPAQAGGAVQATPGATDQAAGTPQPVSGSPVSGSAPVSGSPVSGSAPVSGAPQPVAASAPVSGSPQPAAESPWGAAAPTAYQAGYPAQSAYAPQQGGSPHTVSPFSVPPTEPPQRSRWPLIGVIVLALVILLGGGGVLAFILWPDDSEPVTQPTPTTSAPSLDPSQLALVGQWDMDEGLGETASDSSGRGNHATLVNGVTWTTDGRGGTPAVEYDDPAGHLVTEAPVLQTDQSFTVSAWVRLSQEADHHQYVLSQSGTDASSFALLYRSDGLWGFSVTSLDDGEVNWHNLSSTSSPALSEWAQVVGVYDQEQGEIRIYVNGRLEGSAEATVQPSADTGLMIGNGGSGRFYGTVDTVRAYQSALTDDQIAGLYEQELGAG